MNKRAFRNDKKAQEIRNHNTVDAFKYTVDYNKTSTNVSKCTDENYYYDKWTRIIQSHSVLNDG